MDIPDFLVRRMREWDGRLYHDQTFLKGEFDRYHGGGPWWFFKMMADASARILDFQGGLGPYVYSCTDEGHGLYTFRAEEQIND